MLLTLLSITLRQWRIHKLRTALTLLSISLGVSVFFAALIASNTLMASLKVTVEKMAGKATLQVAAGESGFPEETLDIVRETPGVKIAEPVIEVLAHTAFPDAPTLMIMGVDTTGESELHEYEFDESDAEISDPLIYLAQPDSILVSKLFADKFGLKEEDKLPLFTSKGRKEFTVRGVFKPKGMGEVFGGQVAVIDVYSAQYVFNRGRSFDRIDIMTDPSVSVDAVKNDLRSRLTTGIEVDRPSSRGESLENTVAGMGIGMKVTSFIALLVGVFIIFNSFSISVNQRWKEIGILRAIGVESNYIAKMFLAEAALMGLIGSIAGIVIGFYLADGVTKFMSFIAMQMYSQVSTSIPSIFRLDYAIGCFALGMISTLFAAWFPTRAASQLNPALVLHNIEVRRRESVIGWPRMISGLALTLTGLLLIRFTSGVGLNYQFGYSLLMTAGMVLMLPKLSQWTARALRPLMNRVFGSEGALAVDSMIEAPRRTSATVGALMVSLMFVFSTAAYVHSFKARVSNTLNRTINSDFFVATSEQARTRTYHFSEDLSDRIAAIPGVKRIENIRVAFVPYGNDTTALVSLEMEGWFARVKGVFVEGDEKAAREKMIKGEGALIAENFAKRWGTKVGDVLRVETPKGTLEQPILGIIEDYTSEKGSFFIDRALYKEYWNDAGVDFIDVNALPGADKTAIKLEIQKAVSGEMRAFVYTNEEFRNHIMELIDGFFVMNYMQMMIAIIVAAIGIFNTLVISVSERKREIGILRAIGGLRGQIRKMILLEATAIALIGLITGWIAGMLNTYFMIRTAAVVIAGIVLPFNFPMTLILAVLPIIVAVALAAAWWPARNAVNLKVVDAIGYE